MSRPETRHASAVLLGERGVLIRGASGAGKSSLVVDLLAARPGDARLVADDRVIVTSAHGRLVADVPDEIAGLIEIRGVGIVRVPYVAPVIVRLVVDLVPIEVCPRLPEAEDARITLEGVDLPRIALPIGVGGSAARINAAAAAISGPAGVRPIASCVAESNGQDAHDRCGLGFLHCNRRVEG